MSSRPSSALDSIAADLARVLEAMRGDDGPQPQLSLDVTSALADCARARENYQKVWSELLAIDRVYERAIFEQLAAYETVDRQLISASNADDPDPDQIVEIRGRANSQWDRFVLARDRRGRLQCEMEALKFG